MVLLALWLLLPAFVLTLQSLVVLSEDFSVLS